MHGYVLRRSLVSLATLVGLLVIVGGIVVWAGVPVWVPLIASLLLIAIQYAVNPRLIEWLIHADVVALRRAALRHRALPGRHRRPPVSGSPGSGR